MSDISRERRLEILENLSSENCMSCGGFKKSKMSHCRKCYFRLPKGLRNRLYRRVGQGYEEAFEESLEFLCETNLTASAR